MKANEAPGKICMPSSFEYPDSVLITSFSEGHLEFHEDIEYTRTDAFIEKACQWFENYLFDLGYPDDWCRDSPNIESGKERFIKAMKGE